MRAFMYHDASDSVEDRKRVAPQEASGSDKVLKSWAQRGDTGMEKRI